MAHKDRRRAQFLLYLPKQCKNLLLYRYIQRSSGLIGEENLGISGKRNRHHTALTHTPGKVVRILPHALLRPVYACQFHQFPHSVMHNLPGDSRLVQPYSFPNLGSHGHRRI